MFYMLTIFVRCRGSYVFISCGFFLTGLSVMNFLFCLWDKEKGLMSWPSLFLSLTKGINLFLFW